VAVERRSPEARLDRAEIAGDRMETIVEQHGGRSPCRARLPSTLAMRLDRRSTSRKLSLSRRTGSRSGRDGDRAAADELGDQHLLSLSPPLGHAGTTGKRGQSAYDAPRGAGVAGDFSQHSLTGMGR
jgi:hypothetical protein